MGLPGEIDKMLCRLLIDVYIELSGNGIESEYLSADKRLVVHTHTHTHIHIHTHVTMH